MPSYRTLKSPYPSRQPFNNRPHTSLKPLQQPLLEIYLRFRDAESQAVVKRTLHMNLSQAEEAFRTGIVDLSATS